MIAGKAVALGEALKPGSQTYIDNVVEELRRDGRWPYRWRPASGDGRHQPPVLVDLTPADVTGKDAEKLLESVGLTVNKNTIPSRPHQSVLWQAAFAWARQRPPLRGLVPEHFNMVGKPLPRPCSRMAMKRNSPRPKRA